MKDWPLLIVLALILAPWVALAWLHGRPGRRPYVDDWQDAYYGRFAFVN